MLLEYKHALLVNETKIYLRNQQYQLTNYINEAVHKFLRKTYFWFIEYVIKTLNQLPVVMT